MHVTEAQSQQQQSGAMRCNRLCPLSLWSIVRSGTGSPEASSTATRPVASGLVVAAASSTLLDWRLLVHSPSIIVLLVGLLHSALDRRMGRQPKH
jgi:hypothetical protein